jgi:hypothetical protein
MIVIPRDSVFALNYNGAKEAGIFKKHGIDLTVDARKADRSLMLRKVMISQLMPYIFSSLRIALSLSWKIALVAEAFGVASGVGQKITYWFQQTRRRIAARA